MESLNPLQTQTMGADVGPETDQVDKILSSKPVLLNNPGTVIDNSLYYNFSNAQLVAAEAVQNNGRFSQSLSSTAFGSTSSIIIPNSSFLSGVTLYAELGALPDNVFLPRGWLLNAIESLSFILGSSNVSQLTYNSQSHANIYMANCETAEKRLKAMRLAGEEYSAGVAQAPGTINKAQVQLQLPWSKINALCKKLPFDTNLLSNPIILQIRLKPKNEIFSGSNYLNAPSSFDIAKVYATQIDLMDKELSLKNFMYQEPQLSYNYPFIFNQSYQVDFTGNTTDGVRLNLLTIINADLVGIGMQVVKQSNLSAGPTGANALSPFNWERVKDIQLSFNGLIFADFPGDMCELAEIQDYPGSGMVPYSVVTSGGAGPYVSTPQDVRSTYFSFTRLRNTVFCDHFQNSIRISNNALNLQFKTQSNDDYRLFITYYYNGVFGIRQGQSALILE
jgi:hypothetical protein